MADSDTTPNPIDTTPPTTEQTPPTGQQPAGERMFSQAEVNRIVADRVAREKSKPAETARPNAQTPPPTKNDPPPAPQAADVRAEINRIRSFERAAGSYGLDADALEVLEQDFNTANPSDPAEWVHRRAKAFKWKAGGPATPATPAPTTVAPQTAPGHPVTAGGSPANPANVVDGTPIMRMSNEAREAYRARIGDEAFVSQMRKEFRTTRVKG